jgi:hypothetical protein
VLAGYLLTSHYYQPMASSPSPSFYSFRLGSSRLIRSKPPLSCLLAGFLETDDISKHFQSSKNLDLVRRGIWLGSVGWQRTQTRSEVPTLYGGESFVGWNTSSTTLEGARKEFVTSSSSGLPNTADQLRLSLSITEPPYGRARGSSLHSHWFLQDVVCENLTRPSDIWVGWQGDISSVDFLRPVLPVRYDTASRAL